MFDNLQPVGLTPRAAEEVRKIMQTKNIPAEYGLRVGVRGGGCGGAALIIGFDKAKPADIIYELEGISIYIDKKHTLYLIGKEVDFYEGADAKGFMFTDAAEGN
ncbi:MAG: iron-sulfur cluster assembly accessory protein [Cyclobacteriaceae bacterium]|nr:iron-sulfur cluster assembly accessory protein [Cytophagales bacterium]MBX2901276.1 iron-sulfur cluster assembly accessory protein [Cyclobacteriaceae bacterium]